MKDIFTGELVRLSAFDTEEIAKAYVKVYAQRPDGSNRFYKDGYTDLRGKFDYTSLNTNELDNVDKFSLLILSDTDGAVVRERRHQELADDIHGERRAVAVEIVHARMEHKRLLVYVGATWCEPSRISWRKARTRSAAGVIRIRPPVRSAATPLPLRENARRASLWWWSCPSHSLRPRG